ncbi:acyltransferase [Nocardioides zeae]|uniref:Acyltransferase n=1 Tax=Nocardioides imazamoxiresistens TaxID=3231893 RepID=A0ABU3PZ84_9ACTN|nr:acyltransferase [Nocardioides zeae]MDT9594558.1 acyltransferase [Nocardioides zeae]
MTVTPPEPARAWFPVLDTLRAVGALAVLTTHVAYGTTAYTVPSGYLGVLLARLDVGVALFFVLSGFLLARPYLASAAEGRPAPATGVYARRRFLRVVPLALLTVVVALVFLEDNRHLSWLDRVAALTLTSSYATPSYPAGITHFWSLAVEVVFYVALPALMVLVVGRRSRRLRADRLVGLLVVGAAVSVLWFGLAVPAVEAAGAIGSPTTWPFGYALWFAVGIALAGLFELDRVRRGGWPAVLLRRLARQPGVCWAVAGGLLLLMATPIAGPATLAPVTPTAHVIKVVVYAVVAGLVVLTGVFPSSPRYTTVLTHRAGRRLGIVSYGIFCLHLPVLHLVLWATGWGVFNGRFTLTWLMTVAVTLVVAELAYRWVEEPAQRLGRRREDRFTAPGTPGTPGAPGSGSGAARPASAPRRG